MAESSTSVPQHVRVGRIDSSTRFPTTGNRSPRRVHDHTLPPSAKRTPPTPTCLSSTTPTTRTSAWIPTIRSHQTKPISEKTRSREQSRLTPRRPPSSPTSPTHDATSSKHSSSPPSATCNARNRSGPNPKTTWPRWTTQYGRTSAKSDAFHSSTPSRSNTWHAVSRRWHTCTRSAD